MSSDKEIKKGNGRENNQQTLTSDKEGKNKLEILMSKLWSFLKNIVKSITEIKIFGIGFKVGRKASEQVVLTDDEAVKKQLKPGDIFRECEGCPEMVVVPAGSFMMGSPKGEKDECGDEGPQHQVTISKPFAVGKYEVTRGQFADFVDATRHKAGNEWSDPVFKQNDAHPVVGVSWDDAKAYVDWLSSHTGQQYRLLSEAEWEYVARAGTTTSYHFGDTISQRQANYDGWNKGGTVAVGSYPANDFGLHDMHGNVWEWVEDCWHGDYKGAPKDGIAWLSDCYDEGLRVLRGGSWIDTPRCLRSAFRSRNVTSYRSFSYGFRVARTLAP